MREILFRGKRADNGNWAYGYFVSQGKESYIFEQGEVDKGIDLGGYLDCCQMREVIPDTVGQYIGVEDKDGRPIFEGDIVKTEFGRRCVVVWFSSRKCCGWDLIPLNTVTNCVRTKPPSSDNLFNSDCLELVGNIHND